MSQDRSTRYLNWPAWPVHTARDVCDVLQIARYNEALLQTFPHPPPALPGYMTFFDPGLSVFALVRNPAVHYRNPPGETYDFSLLQWVDLETMRECPPLLLEEAPCYRQICMEVEDTLNRYYIYQLPFLDERDEVPKVRVVMTAVVVHYLLTGQRLFADYMVRCLEGELNPILSKDTTDPLFIDCRERWAVGPFPHRNGLDLRTIGDTSISVGYGPGLGMARKL